MADSVAEGVEEEGLDVEVERIHEAKVEDLLSADGIILGSPTYYGIMAGPLENFIDESIKYQTGRKGRRGLCYLQCSWMR
jgi:NAD(P)H dehydrogenase (quinone)